MTIVLSEVEFENDFFSVDLPDGSVLTLNKVDEDISYGGEDVKISNINIQLTSQDADTEEYTYMQCPCIIGMGNDMFVIETAYTEYEGEVLTSDNMKYCTIEVYE